MSVNIIRSLALGAAGLFLPLAAWAQFSTRTSPDEGLGGVIRVLSELLQAITPVVIGIGVVLFLWGVVRYIASGDDEEKRNSARNLMIYGIIGIFVMVGVWGLVRILGGTFGVLEQSAPSAPELPL